MAREPTPKSIIAEATGAAASKNPLGKQVEEAMRQAIIDANSEGITDSVEIKKRIDAAVLRAKGGESA